MQSPTCVVPTPEVLILTLRQPRAVVGLYLVTTFNVQGVSLGKRVGNGKRRCRPAFSDIATPILLNLAAANKRGSRRGERTSVLRVERCERIRIAGVESLRPCGGYFRGDSGGVFRQSCGPARHRPCQQRRSD